MVSAFTPARFRWAALDGWQRLAVVLWVVILAGSFGRGVLSPTSRHIGIYAVYAEAGRNWLAGAPVYPPQDGWDAFPYSPIVAVFLVPWGALPDALGSGLWRLFLGAVYLGSLAWWARAALPRALTRGERGLLFLLVIPVTAPTMLNGQAGGLVIGMILLALAAAAEERWNWASAFAVLACLIKAYPVAVALLLAVTYPRRMAPRLLAAGALALAVPFLCGHPGYVLDQYAGWLHLLRSSDRLAWPLEMANRNLSLLFRVWLVPLSRHLHLGLQLAAAAGVAGLCLAGRRAGWPHRRLLLAVLGLAGCWMTLFGPVVESFTYILVGPTLAWMVIEARHQGRSVVYRGLLGASWSIFTAATAAIWFPQTIHFHSVGPHPVAGTLLLGCLLVDLCMDLRAGRWAQPETSAEVVAVLPGPGARVSQAPDRAARAA
jgi:hypothetical protein